MPTRALLSCVGMSPPFAPVPVIRQELIQELELGGLRFTEAWHKASSTIARHAHRWATLTFLADGSFEETYPLRRDVACVAPAIHVRPPGEPHFDRLGTAGAHNLVLEVDDTRLETIRRHSPIFDEVRCLASAAALQLARGIQRELATVDGASALVLEGLALELLGTASRSIVRPESRVPPWLRRVRDLLHDRFREPSLRLDDLALAGGVHPVYLARAFRVHFATSPGEYLRRLRVEWAADEIRHTRRPLADIASEAGFADQSHLSRVFKQHLGCTPGAWRRG